MSRLHFYTVSLSVIRYYLPDNQSTYNGCLKLTILENRVLVSKIFWFNCNISVLCYD